MLQIEAVRETDPVLYEVLLDQNREGFSDVEVSNRYRAKIESGLDVDIDQIATLTLSTKNGTRLKLLALLESAQDPTTALTSDDVVKMLALFSKAER